MDRAYKVGFQCPAPRLKQGSETAPNPWSKEACGIDKPVDYYFGHGHNGPHCMQGVPYDLKGYDNDFMEISNRDPSDPDLQRLKPQCIMFGSTEDSKKEEFCPSCARALRRIDLTDGWPVNLGRFEGKVLPPDPKS